MFTPLLSISRHNRLWKSGDLWRFWRLTEVCGDLWKQASFQAFLAPYNKIVIVRKFSAFFYVDRQNFKNFQKILRIFLRG